MILNILTNFNISQLFSTATSLAASLIGITAIIVFHEFGHFIFCKLFKVYTPTFSIGIGKKLISYTIADTEFCISAAPLGGYVEIATEPMHGQKGFNSISYLQKVAVMLGGIACNILFAYIIFTCLFFTGMPDSPFMPYENTVPTIEHITPTSINKNILQKGDQIITLEDQTITTSEQIKYIINQALAQQKTSISGIVLRNKQKISCTLNLHHTENPLILEQRLEVNFVRKAPLSLFASVYESIKLTHFYMHAIFTSLKGIFSYKNSQQLAGPIMTLASSTKFAQKGLKSLLIFLAIISINLGIMNLLPLPIFDGGQFVIFTIETILRKEMSDNVKEKIGFFSWFLILSFMVIFSIKDIYTLTMQYFI